MLAAIGYIDLKCCSLPGFCSPPLGRLAMRTVIGMFFLMAWPALRGAIWFRAVVLIRRPLAA